MIDVQRLAELFESAHGRRIVCVGDIMLDRYVYGDVKRVSAEAPIPVLRQGEVRSMLGAAGNVARNVASLGAIAVLVGTVGDDPAGAEVINLVGSTDGIEGDLIPARDRPTTLKTRYVAGGQQLLRVDSETTTALAPTTEANLIDAASAALEGAGVLLISDYAKGTISDALMKALVKAAQKARVPIIVDPKGTNFARYGEVDVIKPNAAELAEATGMPCDTNAHVEAACAAMFARCAAKTLIVTRSSKGMTLATRDGGFEHAAARPLEVFDVSGAGDTSLAALAVTLAGKGTLSEAMQTAISASGVAVSKIGTATVFAEEVIDAAERDGVQLKPQAKFMDAGRAHEQADGWRRKGLSVGFTNGCFDVLHAGHVDLLRQARGQCDRLVVGLNSDTSVKRLKGASRPVNEEAARAAVLAALATVDLVVLFEDDTPIDLIRLLKPDVLIKGADYSVETVVGAPDVIENGGRVFLAALSPGLSTTNTIKRMKDSK
jgi:D-beta-D-heptose 7-phosphate kinase / D-beta-D-heptose 1-phosphate adenosyltransferase